MLLNFADLGAARSSSKWIFPSMGLCIYILHILNLVLMQHKLKRLSDTRAQVQKLCPVVHIYSAQTSRNYAPTLRTILRETAGS